MYEDIDFETLRTDLINYFGTAACSGFPAAMMDVIEVENADNSKLIMIALRHGFDLDEYEVKTR